MCARKARPAVQASAAPAGAAILKDAARSTGGKRIVRQDGSPAVRRRKRLHALINASDAHGNACTFDPWPLAIDETDPLKKIEAADSAWSGSLMRRPFFQLMAAKKCLELRPAIEEGDGGAVLEAVAQCAAHGLVMPAWLALAFVKRYERVVMGDCRDWNDKHAFGPALSKGENVAGLRAKKQDAAWAYEVAVSLLTDRPNRAIDRALYEEIGESIGKGHDQVRKLIGGYVNEDFSIWPPLKAVRDGLRSGHEFGAVVHSWNKQKEK